MALLSPGVEVTVIDESQTAPPVSTSIPYILMATAQDKASGTDASATATGTTAANANVVTPVSSRRELLTLFGTPTFQVDVSGSIVQGHELNEYGLQTAYSILGVTNRVYVQRADIDLSELIGTSVRPTNEPADGTLWFDIADTDFGLFEWNQPDQTFNKITPIVIDDVNDQTAGVPNGDIGTIGDYAVVVTSVSNPVYYKDRTGTWLLVGVDGVWNISQPTYQGTVANPIGSIGDMIDVNTVTVTLTGTTLAAAVIDFNTAGITGVTAADVDNKLTFYADETAESDGATADGAIFFDSPTGTITADFGIVAAAAPAGLYSTLDVQLSPHTQVPTWKTNDATNRASGSVWVKTTPPNQGADFEVNRFVESTGEFQRIDSPLYANDYAANKALDSVGGGVNISSGSLYWRYDLSEDGTITYALYTRAVAGATTVTGSATLPVTFTPGDTFTVQVSTAGSDVLTSATTVTLTSGTTAADFVTDLLAAGIPGLTSQVNTAGQIEITHTLGGVIVLVEDPTVGATTIGTPITDAGISTSSLYVESGNAAPLTVDTQLIVSNWVKPIYTASSIAPSVDPVDGTLWYFSDVNDVDIMIHDGSAWLGYQNGGIDARGADLSLTDPDGPQVAASEPTTQSDGTPLELGDLWIDTSDLDNYPVIYRWTDLGGGDEGFVLIDNADQTSENGILFADARWDWADNGTDPITGDFPTIAGVPGSDLITSDYLDLDAPEADLYPKGTLLWNTRRSGFNVKQFIVDYFNAGSFTGTLPVETNVWKTASGNQLDGSPYMGSGAVRNMVVTAMKAAVDTSLTVREETTTVNLLAAPGYPELISNLVTVNTDRKETSFVVGDSPLKLEATSLALQNWASNANLATDNGDDGLVTFNNYLGVYYPAGLGNDLNGLPAVLPSSYMSLRTIIKSDNVSYPWIAPAGIRRGLVDNATAIGYIDSAEGEFQSINLGEGLRDVLYTNNVNPISVLPGAGITVYGQKTRAATTSALDRINVARLTANLRFVLSLIAKPFIFEPNDKLTRDEFKNEIEKYLNELVAKRGIFDYLVVCDKSNNTDARIDRNELWADVSIEPVKAAEFIFIPLRIKNTGEI